MIVTILALIFVFGLIVFSHELGHYLAARAMGVTVQKFAFGFPPRIWSKKVGETEYTINALPLGGYVSLLGENELEDEDKKAKPSQNSMLAKKPWQLIIIFVSGVIMNFLLAVLLLAICYLVGFKPIAPGMADYPGVISTEHVTITQVEQNSPAEKQGIKVGDTILAVGGVKTKTTSAAVTQIAKAKDTGAADVTIKRGDETINKQISTYQSKVGNSTITRVGITLSDAGTVSAGFFSAIYAAFLEVFRLLYLTFAGIISLFSQLIFSFKVSDQITGPVGIVVATSYFAGMGFTALLQFAAVLSISLAAFNILPIPALDGGHILFSSAELVSRRKISAKVKNSAALVGFSLLILLIVVVTVKDFSTFDIVGMIKKAF